MDPILQSYDEWVYSNEDATILDYEEKKKGLSDLIQKKFPEYAEIMEKEKKDLEEAIRKSAKSREVKKIIKGIG